MSVMCVCEGDFGYYDNDGYFFVVDRLKELIKYNAYQVLSLQCARYQRLVSRKIVNVSVSSRSREADVSVSSRSWPFTSRAQDQFLAKLCKPQYAV